MEEKTRKTVVSLIDVSFTKVRSLRGRGVGPGKGGILSGTTS